jgi:hypothetical protein
VTDVAPTDEVVTDVVVTDEAPEADVASDVAPAEQVATDEVPTGVAVETVAVEISSDPLDPANIPDAPQDATFTDSADESPARPDPEP